VGHDLTMNGFLFFQFKVGLVYEYGHAAAAHVVGDQVPNVELEPGDLRRDTAIEVPGCGALPGRHAPPSLVVPIPLGVAVGVLAPSPSASARAEDGVAPRSDDAARATGAAPAEPLRGPPLLARSRMQRGCLRTGRCQTAQP
jgi:hypothetical protein